MGLTRDEAADLFRAPPARYLATAAGEVAYRRAGEGPDVLFVHGWPVSSATFRNIVPHLADHVTCHFVDLPGAGASRYSADTRLSIASHIHAVRAVVDQLGLDRVAVVGHDSGGLIARHAMAGDPRLSSLGLVDTEPPAPAGWRFRLFLAGRHLPGYGGALAWISGRPRLRRSRFVLGGAFHDRSLLSGEFDEFFLEPLRRSADHRAATTRLLRSFDFQLIRDLEGLHARLDVPVRLVWGAEDPFFPVERARAMLATFPSASLHVVERAALFVHEERPAEVADALLPILTGGPT